MSSEGDLRTTLIRQKLHSVAWSTVMPVRSWNSGRTPMT